MKIIFLKLISSVRDFNPSETVIRYSHVPLKITIRRYVIFKNGGNENSPDSPNVMVNYHYHGKNRVIIR